MQLAETTPLWDVAIANLLQQEQESLGVPFDIESLQKLAVDHAVRLGDIIETLYLLTIYGDWLYTDADGMDKDLDEEALENLYAQGRIDRTNAEAFDGLWQPHTR